jgi:hypothetical protein
MIVIIVSLILFSSTVTENYEVTERKHSYNAIFFVVVL